MSHLCLLISYTFYSFAYYQFLLLNNWSSCHYSLLILTELRFIFWGFPFATCQGILVWDFSRLSLEISLQLFFFSHSCFLDFVRCYFFFYCLCWYSFLHLAFFFLLSFVHFSWPSIDASTQHSKLPSLLPHSFLDTYNLCNLSFIRPC